MTTKKSSYNYDELIACGHSELFGPGNAQLPLPNMLMFDRIIEISEDGGNNGKGHVIAELDVNPDLWFFGCHFEGDPVMPAAWAWTRCGSWSGFILAGWVVPDMAGLWVLGR